MKICSTLSFRGEVKPKVPFCKILRHGKGTYGMKGDTCRQSSWTSLTMVLPALVLGVSASYCQRAVVGESGMIRTQKGKYNRSVMVAVYRMLGDTAL
jgi:hypothetical protein